MEEPSRTAALRVCGTGIQFAAALFLLGGLSGFVIRLATGEWPEFLDHHLSPVVSALVLTLLTVFSVTAILLGQKTKEGNLRAIKCLTLMSWVVFASSLFHLFATGRGWYEMLLCGFLAVDSLVAMAYGDDKTKKGARLI